MDVEHVIVYAFQDSLFPEIVECFGIEKAVEFVKIFGGTTIEIPSVEQIQFIMRDYDIFMQLKDLEVTTDRYSRVVNKLCKDYNLTNSECKAIFKAMATTYIDGVDHKIRGWHSRKSPKTRTLRNVNL